MIDSLNTALGGRLLLEEPMSRHTSFGIGGPAEALFLPKSADEIGRALNAARAFGVSVTVMGNGTNLLVSDEGVRGLVLKLAGGLNRVSIEKNVVRAECGALLVTLASAAAEAGLSGLEFAEGIPGSLGGALSMNAGAYGGEMKDVVDSVSALDRDGNLVVLSAERLDFGYRQSALRSRELIAVEATMKLRRGSVADIRAKMRDFASRRRKTQPLAFKSAGSVFKRPPGHYAGALIERAGLKGRRIGGAQVSTLHAGFIVNTGGATAKDVADLIELVQHTVRDRFEVDLQTEIRFIGKPRNAARRSRSDRTEQ